MDSDRDSSSIQRFWESSSIWFSNKEYYQDIRAQKFGRDNFLYLAYIHVIPDDFRRRLERNKSQKRGYQWSHYPNCFVSIVRGSNDKIKFMIRRNKLIHSRYRKRVCRLRYFYEFETGEIGDLREDSHYEPFENFGDMHTLAEYRRWYVDLGEDRFIWQWQKKGEIKENTELAKIHEALNDLKERPYAPTNSNANSVINMHSQYDGPNIVPVIYQDEDDTKKNFLREIHCYPKPNQTIEITLIFNNEHLIYHNYPLIDPIYRLYRFLRYRRITDVETFWINLVDGIPKEFDFHGIHSGPYKGDDDNIHGDKEEKFRPVLHNYFNKKLPIAFVNTANHALSNRDNSPRLWKCEYLPWEEDECAAMLGHMSRKQIEAGAGRLTNLMTEKRQKRRFNQG